MTSDQRAYPPPETPLAGAARSPRAGPTNWILRESAPARGRPLGARSFCFRTCMWSWPVCGVRRLPSSCFSRRRAGGDPGTSITWNWTGWLAESLACATAPAPLAVPATAPLAAADGLCRRSDSRFGRQCCWSRPALRCTRCRWRSLLVGVVTAASLLGGCARSWDLFGRHRSGGRFWQVAG